MSGGRRSQCGEERCKTTAMTNKSSNDVSDDGENDCDDVRDDSENDDDDDGYGGEDGGDFRCPDWRRLRGDGEEDGGDFRCLDWRRFHGNNGDGA